MKMLLLALTLTALSLPLLASDGPYLPTDAERGRWTMADMNSWRISLAAYKQDHGKFPEAKSAADVKSALEPMYVAHLPMSDAWGRAYAVESHESGFIVASAGADGKFDKQSWSTGGTLSSFDEDAVVTQEGRWLFRHWSMK